jgi:small subunit ribosomal protein S1
MDQSTEQEIDPPTNQTLDQSNPQPEWYENFLTNYNVPSPQVGQVLQGTIVRKDTEGIVVDVGLKLEALIPPKDIEVIDEAKLASLSIGEQIPVYVLSLATNEQEMQVSLSKGIEFNSWEKAIKKMQDGEILNLEVLGYNRGGLIVRFETLRGFVPYSLVPELQMIRSQKRAELLKNSMVGTNIEVKITEVDHSRNRLVLSAVAAQEEKRKIRLKELKKGQKVTGKVVSIVSFGAFVDLVGIDGLVHVSQLDWKKVKHPSELLKVGDEIEVKIINVDLESQRVNLSRKAVLPSPWTTIGETLKAGDYVEGIVTRRVNFGVFVKLPIGIEGLLHNSQIGYSFMSNPLESIKPGDSVLVRILEVNPERKRIALSMRQVPRERQLAWAMENLEDTGVKESNPIQKKDEAAG